VVSSNSDILYDADREINMLVEQPLLAVGLNQAAL